MKSRKRIVLVGASGTIGQAVKAALQADHELISVGHRSGDYQVDMSDEASIISLFKNIGHFNALVVAAGQVYRAGW